MDRRKGRRRNEKNNPEEHDKMVPYIKRIKTTCRCAARGMMVRTWHDKTRGVEDENARQIT
jgi:hypothetical protein